MGKKTYNPEFKRSMLLNSATYTDYLDRLEKICLSMFEWKNLPSSMDERYLEKTLFYKGKASLLKDEKYGYINTQVASGGNINLYGLPNILNCYSHGFQTQRKLYTGLPKKEGEKDDEAILVMNNWDMTATISTIELFAYRLAEAQKTCDVNLNAQRTPILLLCDDKQRLAVENLYSQYEGNKPVIFGNKDRMGNIQLEAINTEAPFLLDKLTTYKKEIWNEFLTFMGINNIDIDKKERLIKGEANANNEVINFNLQALLKPRKKACEEFNEKFGLTGDKAISVKLNSDLHNIIKDNESIITDYNIHIEEEENE